MGEMVMQRLMRWHVMLLGVLMVISRHDLVAGPQPPPRDRTTGEAGRRRGRRLDEQPTWNRGPNSREERPLPGPTDRGRKDWYLGAEVEYRDHGAEIVDIEQGSPARRAGLGVGDIIVTVDGYQVGQVNGRQYALDRELELRADRRGRVALLVQDRGSRRLVNMPVQLEPAERRRDPIRSESIIGTIHTSRFASVPRRGALTIRLLDVTDQRLTDQRRPDEVRSSREERLPPNQVVSERTYRKLGPFPFPFELIYDGQEIEPDRDYALDADITVNGDTEFSTTEPYPVLERGAQGRVHMVLEPVR
ncbi:MAG: YbaY family lipoprotein [bacterium]